MDIERIKKAEECFPFKEVKSKRENGVKFRQTTRHFKKKTGLVLEVEHNGHDHLTLDFRRLYEKENKKIGNKRIMFWTMNTREVVQLSSLLFYMADEYMRDSNEEPYVTITSKEKSRFGSNWIYEDYESAMKRTENRKSRSYLFGLMKRFVETCDNEHTIKMVASMLSNWAMQSKDGFAVQQAENAIAQLGYISKSELN